MSMEVSLNSVESLDMMSFNFSAPSELVKVERVAAWAMQCAAPLTPAPPWRAAL
jgi:hypothetical protein